MQDSVLDRRKDQPGEDVRWPWSDDLRDAYRELAALQERMRLSDEPLDRLRR